MIVKRRNITRETLNDRLVIVAVLLCMLIGVFYLGVMLGEGDNNSNAQPNTTEDRNNVQNNVHS